MSATSSEDNEDSKYENKIPCLNSFPQLAELLCFLLKKGSRNFILNKDVKHHARLGDKWWDVRGVFRGLHAMNLLRVQFVQDGLSKMGITSGDSLLPLDKIKILDTGCGGGILSEPLAKLGAHVTGIDPSIELIETAKTHATLDSSLSERLRYINISIEKHIESHPEEYDAIVASEVIEHVANPKMFLKCCVAALKPGGSIFVTTMNKTTQSWFSTIILAEYIMKSIPLGTHDWRKFISPDETAQMLESYNCQTKLVRGMFRNPFTVSWSWSSSTAINYALHAVKDKQIS